MTEPLILDLAAASDALVHYAIAFLRCGAAMALLPAFGERSIPVRVRVFAAASFAVILAPVIATAFPQAPSVPPLTLLASETVAGLALGAVLRLMIIALQIAGTIAANVMSLSQILGGAAVDPQPAMAHLLLVAGFALATAGGLHVDVVAALILTYDVLPPGEIAPALDLATLGTASVARIFELAFSLSAAFLIVSVIYNMALGAINRAMPQLMVAFVGAPAITAAGLAVLLLTGPLILAVWYDALRALLADPFGA